MKNFRDIENLSAYIDGQLNAADAARLEARLKTDAELASALRDLSAARNILKKLPARKAPRNFTLTRQMVGLKPPLPSTYPLFRFATVFAAILFMCSFTTNTLSPLVSFGFGGAAAPAAAPAYGGMGGGGGCDDCDPAATEEALFAAEAAEEAAATEEAMNMEPVVTVVVVPMGTDTARIAETPTAKDAPEEAPAQDPAADTATQTESPQEPPASFNWTLTFLIIALLSGAVMVVMRYAASRPWR